jgi:hypothetical protein
VNSNRSSGGSGPAQQGSARWTDVSEGDRVFMSYSEPSTRSRARQAGDLFQPVTSSQPPAVVITDQLVTPINGLNHDDELVAAPATQSGYVSNPRRWAGRAAGLVVGTQGAVIALVASAALVLVVAGMTMSTTSAPTESAVAGPTPGQLPVTAVPAVGDEHPVTASPIDAPAESARQTPAVAYSPEPPPAPVHKQPSPPANHAVPARLPSPPPPDNGSVLPPPSMPPPSMVTAEDARYWTITPGSHAAKTESPTTGTQPCNCDAAKRQIHNYRDRSTEVDRGREYRAQRAEYRSTSMAGQSRVNEDRKQDRQAARPDAKTAPRPAPDREP